MNVVGNMVDLLEERIKTGYVFLENNDAISKVMIDLSRYLLHKNNDVSLVYKIFSESDCGVLSVTATGEFNSLKDFVYFMADYAVKPDFVEKYSWLNNRKGLGSTKKIYGFTKGLFLREDLEFFSSFKDYVFNKNFLKEYSDPSSPFSVEG